MNFREFFEAQLADIERLQGQSPYVVSMRKKGLLAKNDPLHMFAASPGDLNIVWITGMWSGIFPGTGNYSQLLKPLGYNVKVVNTKANVFAASLGWMSHGTSLFNDLGKNHIEKNKDVYYKQVDKNPDIIIGSSQGGAVALSLAADHPDIPMLLICPAWRIFKVNPTYINPGSILVHGIHDKEVPIEDSEYLSKKFNIPLFVTEDGHILTKGFWQIIRALKTISSRVLRSKND